MDPFGHLGSMVTAFLRGFPRLWEFNHSRQMHYLKKFAAVARGQKTLMAQYGPIDGWKMLEDDGNDQGINRFGHFTLTSFDYVPSYFE